MAIAMALVIIAVVVFVRGVHDLVLAPHGEQYAVTITRGVNDALFIVVIIELVRTIVARLEGGGFQLQPFLVIGIISATRTSSLSGPSCRWLASGRHWSAR